MRRHVRALLRKGEEGSALVEIALTMPMLLMVMTAICTFAIGFNNQLTLTSAVGSGAQYLQLIRTTTTDPCQDTLNRKRRTKSHSEQHHSLVQPQWNSRLRELVRWRSV
jgi:Flp pilus assembly protein TadG